MSRMGLPPELLSQLRGVFVEEAEQGLREAQEHCAHWQPGQPAPHRIKAVLHGLKGAASSVELDALAELIHRGEELLGASTRPERLAPLLRGLRNLVGQARDGSGLTEEALAEVGSLLDTRAPAPEPLLPAPVTPLPSQPLAVVEHTAVPSAALAEAVRRVSEVQRALTGLEGLPTETEALQRARVGSEELEALLERMRLSPGAEALEGLEAEAAELSLRLGKRVRLELSGRELRLERRALQTARGALRHLLRNALDHGLEPPAERLAAGKPEMGVLKIALSLQDGHLEVRVSDDGRGFDLQAIRARLAPGLSSAQLEAMDDEAVLARFALEGGSTREVASDVSGRGVGLSAVAHLARDVRGAFWVGSRPGQGSEVRFSLPVSAYVAEVLTFFIGQVALALPTSAVVYTARRKNEAADLHTPVGEVVSFAGITARLLDLGVVLGLAPARHRPFVLMVQEGEQTLALGVDEIGSVHRLVPRSAPPVVNPGALVNGLLVLPETGAVQLLNVRRLFQRAQSPLVAGARTHPAAEAGTRPEASPEARPGLEVLLVEDSAATREVYRLLLEADGHRVRTAADGAAGFAAALGSPPDLILSDVDMPVQDGFALTRSIRSHPRLARTPVVLLTSRDDPDSRAQGAACGADAFLLKGTFTPATLREALVRLGLGTRG